MSLIAAVPFHVGASPACRRVRRDSAPAGGSLWWLHNFASQSEHPPAARTFVASNESNQSKDALHLAVSLRLHGFGLSTPCCGQAAHMLRFLRHSPRFASAWTGNVCAANNRIALRPRGRRRGAQGFGAARDSALRQLTSRRLSERRERSEHSEFGARPLTPSTAEQSGPSRTASVGSPFFWFLFFGEAKKRDCPVGGTSRRGFTQ